MERDHEFSYYPQNIFTTSVELEHYYDTTYNSHYTPSPHNKLFVNSWYEHQQQYENYDNCYPTNLDCFKGSTSCAFSRQGGDDTPTPTRFLKFIGGNEYQDHEHPSPFDPLFKKVTSDNCDNLTMAIAKDRRFLNEMIPNGLQSLPLHETQHDSNISTSSSSTLYGPNGETDYQTDIPFPRTQLSNDEIAYGAIATDTTNLLIQANLKTSSSDSLQSDSISTTASTSLDMNMSLISDTPTKKKRGRKPILDEDPVEKRKRYLERNRAAATRCRNKKKVWVNGLEKNINNLVDENTHLKRENQLLKLELRKYSPFKDSLTNLSFQLRPLNSGLDGEDGHDRLTGYLSAATINNPISQASILRPHPGLLLPMATSISPDIYSGNHLPPTNNQ